MKITKLFSEKTNKRILIGIMIIIPILGLLNIMTYYSDSNLIDEIIDTGIMVVFAELMIIIPFLRIGDIKKLKQTGIKIEAELVGVSELIDDKKDIDYEVVVKGFEPQSGKKIDFVSDTLEYDPSKLLPQKINVYLDPANPKKYYVDLEFLKKVKPAELEDKF